MRIVSYERFDPENLLKEPSPVVHGILLAENLVSERFALLIQFLFRHDGNSRSNFYSSRGFPVSESNCDGGFPGVRLEGQAAGEPRHCFSEPRLGFDCKAAADSDFFEEITIRAERFECR